MAPIARAQTILRSGRGNENTWKKSDRNMSDLLNTVAAFFETFSDRLSYGIDVATAGAILGSLGAFLYTQYKRGKAAKKLSLNEAVRSTALSELSVSIRDLAKSYQSEVGSRAMKLNSRMRQYSQRFLSEGEEDPNHFRKAMPSFEKTAELAEEMRVGKEKFTELLSAEMYVIFGLLDSFAEGGKYIRELRENRSKLIALGNELVDHLSLFNELKGLLNIVAEHGNDFAAYSDEVKEDMNRKVVSIAFDPDYRVWVNRFVPDGQEEAYWQAVKASDKTEAQGELLNRVGNNVIVYALSAPGRIMAQVILNFVSASQDIQRQCKESLIILAATTHSLTLAEEDRVDINEIVKRYESDDYFALGSEVT